MIRQTATVTGTSTSNIVVFDSYSAPFNVGIGTVVTGSTAYTVQHTFDDVNAAGYTAASGNWYPHDDTVFVNASANANSNYAFPVTASRIIATGSGSVSATYIQAGGPVY